MKRIQRCLPFLAGLALFASASLRAQTVPPAAGGNFQVSTTSLSSQYGVDVARDAAGDSVFVWTDQAIVPQGILARIFNAAGVAQQFNIFVELDNQELTSPRVAMTPQGEFVVVWANPSNVFLKRFDRAGNPIGTGVTTQQPKPGYLQQPDVAIDAEGNASVVWSVIATDSHVAYLQQFNAANQSLGAPKVISQNADGSGIVVRVASGPSGSLLVSWNDFRAGDFGIWARYYDGTSGTWSPEFRVNDSPGLVTGSAPLIDRSGNAAVVYTNSTTGKILVRQLANGAPSGDSIEISGEDGSTPDVARGDDGVTLVTWTSSDRLLHARYFDAQWNPLSADFKVSSYTNDAEIESSVAAGGGGFSVAWTSDGPGDFPIPVPPEDRNGRDGDLLGVFAQRFQNPTCAGGSEVLCLNNGQFQARVTWKNPYTGETGTGKALALSSDTGSFWFFSPDNLELMIKVLNGDDINGHHWVFYGSLTNVEYTLTITETATGKVKTYHNAPLQLASGSDIEAFPVTAPALTALTAAASTAPLPDLAEKAGVPDGTCVASPTVLCVQRKLFQVEVDFIDPRSGGSGKGRAIGLSDDTGTFWFFGPENLELMVKVLDGRGINNHYWVIFGALSDVEYNLTVTELATGKKKVYHNAPHHQASVQDINAF